MRKKAGSHDQVPAMAESAVFSGVFRSNWARLIQKIYEIDPPCNCRQSMIEPNKGRVIGLSGHLERGQGCAKLLALPGSSSDF